MTEIYIKDQTHTLASGLREILEESYPDDLVSCTILHPLDTHVEIRAPTEKCVRDSLIKFLDKIRIARSQVQSA